MFFFTISVTLVPFQNHHVPVHTESKTVSSKLMFIYPKVPKPRSHMNGNQAYALTTFSYNYYLPHKYKRCKSVPSHVCQVDVSFLSFIIV